MARNMIFLKDMPFMLSVGTDAWQRKGKIQPVHVTVQLDQVSVINEAAFSDDVSKTLDYGKLYKSIQHNLESQKEYDNILQVAEQVLLAITAPGIDVCLQIDLPKATLRAEGGFAYTLNRKTNAETSSDVLCIRGIKCACIIGVNPHERRDKQILIVDLTCRADNNPPAEPTTAIAEVSATRIATTQYHKIIETLVHLVEISTYYTVEALADHLCKHITALHNLPEVEISIAKPYAIPSIGAAGVCIRRRKSFYQIETDPLKIQPEQ